MHVRADRGMSGCLHEAESHRDVVATWNGGDKTAGNSSSRQRAMTAGEFLADPERAARPRELDREIEREEAASREREKPPLAELTTVGIEVSSLWDIDRRVLADNPAAIQLLVEHLHPDWEPGNLDGIARRLALTAAAPYWDEIMELLRDTDLPLQR
jgi:hypothetical protein